MLVIVKSPPETPDGERGVKLARDMAADVVLMQNGIYFAQKERLGGFCGRAYILDEDMRLRGLKDEGLEKGIKKLNHDELIDLIAEEDKVVGMF
ncbi:MAG: hypothetical protein HZA07_02970 [Nitrospirae bacterium]|nr:hypothetical protein [Nitrospirota bacterium]